MSNWKQTKVDVVGKEEETILIVFTFLKDIALIKNIDVTCGCTNYKLDGMFLKVNLKLPKKFITLDSTVFNTTKYLYITYQDDTTDTLTINATVYVK